MKKNMLQFTISGQPFSKANSRRLIGRMGNRPMFIKSEKALNYETQALWQLKMIVGNHKPFTLPVVVEMIIFYPDRRQDLDPSLVLDIMQKAGVYQNDRLVEVMHLYRQIDKLNPRTEVRIYER